MYDHSHEARTKAAKTIVFYVEMYESVSGHKPSQENITDLVRFVHSKMPLTKIEDSAEECLQLVNKGSFQSRTLVECSVNEVFGAVYERSLQTRCSAVGSSATLKKSKNAKKRKHSANSTVECADQLPSMSCVSSSASGQAGHESQPSTQHIVINPSTLPTSVPINVGYQDPLTGQQLSYFGYLILFPRLFWSTIEDNLLWSSYLNLEKILNFHHQSFHSNWQLEFFNIISNLIREWRIVIISNVFI